MHVCACQRDWGGAKRPASLNSPPAPSSCSTHQWAECEAESCHSACGSWRTSCRLGPESTQQLGSRADPDPSAAACEWSTCRTLCSFCPASGPPLPSSAGTVPQTAEQSLSRGSPAPEVGRQHPPVTEGTNPLTSECAALWPETPRRWAAVCHPPP